MDILIEKLRSCNCSCFGQNLSTSNGGSFGQIWLVQNLGTTYCSYSDPKLFWVPVAAVILAKIWVQETAILLTKIGVQVNGYSDPKYGYT